MPAHIDKFCSYSTLLDALPNIKIYFFYFLKIYEQEHEESIDSFQAPFR